MYHRGFDKGFESKSWVGTFSVCTNQTFICIRHAHFITFYAKILRQILYVHQKSFKVNLKLLRFA